MPPKFRLASEELLSLAPLQLSSRRPARYQGDDKNVPLGFFPREEQQTILTLYSFLLKIYETLSPFKGHWETGFKPLLNLILEYPLLELVGMMQGLGKGLPSTSPAIAQAVHDLRGGALTSLILRLEFLKAGYGKVSDTVPIYFLTRDHLKIMRNALRDLDPGSRAMDSQQKLHHISLLTEKWSNAIHWSGTKQVSVLLDVHYQGNVAESCLEFSALDRVIYNFINNAARFTADDAIEFHIVQVPPEDATNLRFVIVNTMTPEQKVNLNARFEGHSIEKIFHGGFTTGGTGHGLRICAEFVANAYGLLTIDEALQLGLLGISLIEKNFVCWFHWPVAD